MMLSGGTGVPPVFSQDRRPAGPTGSDSLTERVYQAAARASRMPAVRKVQPLVGGTDRARQVTVMKTPGMSAREGQCLSEAEDERPCGSSRGDARWH
jgi:hypothetical protein